MYETNIFDMSSADLQTYVRASLACGDTDDAITAQNILNERHRAPNLQETTIVGAVMNAFVAARESLDTYPQTVVDECLRATALALTEI